MRHKTKLALAVATACVALAPAAQACTRFLYETGDDNFMVGRGMDWFEDTKTDLWTYPAGIERGREMGENAFVWTAKHGSLMATMYDTSAVDGMNEAGLVASGLYLSETDYGDPYDSGRPLIHVGSILQYVLDNHATVAEVVETFRNAPFEVVAPDLPNGSKASGHFSVSDATGDSAVVEYIDGKPVVYHDRKYKVMTNSPTFDEQQAINTYWNEVGGVHMLPGTHRASDRFARMSYNLGAVPAFSGDKAVAAALSLIRSASVPIGITDPEKPNHSSTVWRTVSDIGNRRYYFDSAFSPSLFWVDMENLDFSVGAPVMKLELNEGAMYSGEASSGFVASAPLKPVAIAE